MFAKSSWRHGESTPGSRTRSMERIERLVDGPYLEMFSRQSRPGWDALGDEVGKFDSPTVDRAPREAIS